MLVSTYQAASGAGKGGMEELEEQMTLYGEKNSLEKKKKVEEQSEGDPLYQIVNDHYKENNAVQQKRGVTKNDFAHPLIGNVI